MENMIKEVEKRLDEQIELVNETLDTISNGFVLLKWLKDEALTLEEMTIVNEYKKRYQKENN